MDKDLYNETAKHYVDGFLELTENPEIFEFETLKSYANLWKFNKLQIVAFLARKIVFLIEVAFR